MEPEIELVDPGNFNQIELNKIMKLLKNNESELTSQIEKFLNGEKIYTLSK